MSSSKFLLNKISVITFDIHNVLLTIRNGAIYQYMRLACEHLGSVQSFDESLLQSNFSHAFKTFNQSHPGYGIHKNITSRQWWGMLVKYTFKDYNIQADQLTDVIYDEFSTGKLWVKHPQADEVLKELQKEKILGIISNFDERLDRILEDQQLRQYFQFILTPRNCGLYKPQKEIFQRAVKLANITSNDNLCHIGDDVKLDYQAAKATGCQALLLTKNEETKKRLLNQHKDIDRNDIILNLTDLLSRHT